MCVSLTADEKSLLFPPECREYWRAVRRLTRFIKHNRRLLISHETIEIDSIVAEWCIEARAHFPSAAAANEIDAGDVAFQIATQWPDAHWPLGVSPLAQAVEHAAEVERIPTPPPRYGAAASAVWRVVWSLNLLCLKSGESRFWLSSHDLARRLNLSQPLILRSLRRLEADKILTVAKRGNPGQHGRATVYHTF